MEQLVFEITKYLESNDESDCDSIKQILNKYYEALLVSSTEVINANSIISTSLLQIISNFNKLKSQQYLPIIVYIFYFIFNF